MWKIVQEYSILGSNWTSLRKIIIATNTIPNTNEYVPTKGNSGVTNSFPILTDFTPNFSQVGGETRSIAFYYPTSQYRLVDMISDQPLSKINIKIYWEDTAGNLYPLYISPSQQINLKLAFLRKSLYKPMGLLLEK